MKDNMGIYLDVKSAGSGLIRLWGKYRFLVSNNHMKHSV